MQTHVHSPATTTKPNALLLKVEYCVKIFNKNVRLQLTRTTQSIRNRLPQLCEGPAAVPAVW